MNRIRILPGATLPQGAVAAMFPTPSLPPNASVRITYADAPVSAWADRVTGFL